MINGRLDIPIYPQPSRSSSRLPSLSEELATVETDRKVLGGELEVGLGKGPRVRTQMCDCMKGKLPHYGMEHIWSEQALHDS
ncbi:hypothetical protein Q8A67_022355 [Cirrhinus molitorella]|uniref:Uncharacterized protein n=1 Tax=Cirrhinus molitorella TaxID=172907 RepID=A0AA88P6E5_9TELE|nr:hypothetical protein Q8A67_022355 [Cirrhinus molitorella]